MVVLFIGGVGSKKEGAGSKIQAGVVLTHCKDREI